MASPVRVEATAEDVFTGFNVFSIALEVPMTDIFPNGIPHNGALIPNSTNSLIRVWSRITRRRIQVVDPNNSITGLQGFGPFVQVGRNALPLFNAGLVGTQRQSLYLRSSPLKDVTNFGADVLFPVLVRDAEALGIYTALGVPPSASRASRDRGRTSSGRSTWVGRFQSPTGPLAMCLRWTLPSIRRFRTADALAVASRRTVTKSTSTVSSSA